MRSARLSIADSCCLNEVDLAVCGCGGGVSRLEVAKKTLDFFVPTGARDVGELCAVDVLDVRELPNRLVNHALLVVACRSANLPRWISHLSVPSSGWRVWCLLLLEVETSWRSAFLRLTRGDASNLIGIRRVGQVPRVRDTLLREL